MCLLQLPFLYPEFQVFCFSSSLAKATPKCVYFYCADWNFFSFLLSLSAALCDMHPMRALFLIPRNPPPRLKSKKWWDNPQIIFYFFLFVFLFLNDKLLVTEQPHWWYQKLPRFFLSQKKPALFYNYEAHSLLSMWNVLWVTLKEQMNVNRSVFYYTGCCTYRGWSEMKYLVIGAKTIMLYRIWK